MTKKRRFEIYWEMYVVAVGLMGEMLDPYDDPWSLCDIVGTDIWYLKELSIYRPKKIGLGGTGYWWPIGDWKTRSKVLEEILIKG